MKLYSVLSWKRLFLIYSLPLIIAICMMSVFDVFRQPNLFFLDQAFQWRGTREPADGMVIVAISQEDFEQGAPRWPWPRSLMARLIDQISSYQPDVIAIDILFTERTNTETVITREQFANIQPYLYHMLSGVKLQIQTPEGLQDFGPDSPGFDEIASGANSAREQDLELAVALQAAIDNGVSLVLGTQVISGEQFAGLAEPIPELAAVVGDDLGLVGVRLDTDGVLRRYIPYGQDKYGEFYYGLALAAVAKSEGLDLPKTPLPNGDVMLGDSLKIKVTDGQFSVNFAGPPGTYPTFIARDILEGKRDFSDQLKDKIVFLGVTDPSANDLQPTPFTGTNRMPGIEFHAAAADTILSGSFIGGTPRYQELLLIAAFGFAAIALGRFSRPLVGFGGVVLMAGGLFGAWFGSFVWANHALPLVSLLSPILLGFAFAITDRVGVEQLEKQQARSMLSRYLAPEVVMEMIKDPTTAQLGGKRADITVLFSDIRGFTTLSEQLDPEEVVDLLNEYLTVMTEVIFRHEGTVDKFEGDAILAFFGAPRSHDDDAERAIRTALEMRDRLVELEVRWKEKTHASLQIGIGINTGQAIVGNIGSHRRMDYTIIGDTVNLASRIQELTKEYHVPILITGSTQTRVNHMCQPRFIDSVEVRGRQQPVDLYTLVDLKSNGDAQGNNSLSYATSGG